jgi:SNF2 family DNA or RNA helicase
VSTSERQNMVDRLTAAKGAAVLVSQIQAGGVGLNIQAASVVILCEPQVKPSMESQAIARAHRMGQVRSVQVHRLLIEDSVDQRMLEILGSKQALFDEYARQSDIAVNTPEAMDISEVALARDVVAAEQERLAKELMARLDADGNSTASLAEG